MVERTGTEWAPWHLVEGDSKRFARVKVVETVIAAAEEGLARHGRVPPPRAADLAFATPPLRYIATGAWQGIRARQRLQGGNHMRRSLCALLAVPVALATASPASRRRTTRSTRTASARPSRSRAMREHQPPCRASPRPTTASARRARPATTPRWTTWSARLEEAGYDVGGRSSRSTTSEDTARRSSTASRRSPRVYHDARRVHVDDLLRLRRRDRRGDRGRQPAPARSARLLGERRRRLPGRQHRRDPARRLPVQGQGDQRPERGRGRAS